MAQTGTEITRVAEALIDAFNAADWHRLRPLVASDVVYTETGTGRRMESADAYFALLDGWKRALPDVTGTIQAMVAGDGIVAQKIHWEGTQTGPLETPGGVVEASGKRISVDATAWFRFRGGTISEIHHHLDVLMLLMQIGAIPAPAHWLATPEHRPRGKTAPEPRHRGVVRPRTSVDRPLRRSAGRTCVI